MIDDDESFDDESEEEFDIFAEFEGEFLKFERVEKKLNNRPDIHAFLMLDGLFPGDRDIISGAEHDIVWLDIDVERLSHVATKEQLRDLSRCGVHYDSETDSLAMFC